MLVVLIDIYMRAFESTQKEHGDGMRRPMVQSNFQLLILFALNSHRPQILLLHRAGYRILEFGKTRFSFRIERLLSGPLYSRLQQASHGNSARLTYFFHLSSANWSSAAFVIIIFMIFKATASAS